MLYQKVTAKRASAGLFLLCTSSLQMQVQTLVTGAGSSIGQLHTRILIVLSSSSSES